MRIGHVISPGPLAGAENVVLQGCEALASSGHAICLVILVERRCPQHAQELSAAARARGIPVRTVSVGGRLDLRALSHLRETLASSNSEVVHAHGYKALLYSMLARPRAARLVVTHHGETGHDRVARFYEALARALYRWVDCVFTVSGATTEELVGGGVPRSKLKTVPNPVSLRPPKAKAEGNPSDGALLFVGRLSEEKGLGVLLRALAASRECEDFTLDVAGDGPCADRWKALGASLGLNGRVRWLGKRDDVPDLLAGAGALVLPSLREGLPLAVLEAASFGVPVVASRVGGVPEAVWEGESAMLVEPGDIKAWSSALEALPEEAERLRQGARERAPEIRARHAPERWAELTTQHYREVVR
jgi:glycosyltransferase involved in cell wall biosynthesis